jgi:YidC/Oxa1 family membrane protein insertase
MDKKNTFLGITFVAAGIGFMFWQSYQLQEQRREQLQQQDQAGETAPAEETTPEKSPQTTGESETSAPVITQAADADEFFKEAEVVEPVEAEPSAEEKTVTLSNDYIEAVFTTRGGAIRTVSFLQTKRGGRDDYVFNRGGLLPAMSLSYRTEEGRMREFALDYQIETQTRDSVTFILQTGNGMITRRTYRIAATGSTAEPYVIEHRTEIGNRSETATSLDTVYLNLGTARPISENQIGANYLNVGHFDGEDADFIGIKKLTGGKGFLGIGASAPRDQIEVADRIEWASVKNQFFASVLSSETVADDLYIYPVEAAEDGDAAPGRPGISGSAGYEIGVLRPGQSKALDFQFYVGPKEFKRLQALGNQQDLVMQFGFLGFFSKLLLAFMYAIHSVVPSWGWSIVIMTICIKLLFWPLTAKASKSQKRMAKIQGPMSELKEKYKDNPQKMQQETLKLFKEHQVNPLAGCLPMIIQMPIFLGLFYMLRTASELRHEPFLWVSDLAQPDTIMEIGGFPINLLPLLMGLTMFLQMHMMPVSPTADPMQQKIFKFMPAIFLVFLYNFASGLTLYWTVQNILTIVQQKITNSRPDEEPVPAASQAAKPKAGGKAGGKARKKKSK